MLTALAVLLALAFIGWIIYRAARKKLIKAHLVMYWLSSLAGIFTLAFFLTMDIPRIIKVLICIVLGAALIFLAAYSQRRRQPG
jgi:ABC-type Fe3+-siderophore transport system permease subunit